MAAKIRLKRVGRKGQAAYRVVVLDGRKPRDAKVVQELGHFDPKTNPPSFEIDSEGALKWLLDGAKATKAARDILAKAGVMAAWDAAKRGETTVAIEPKEQRPSAKHRKKDEPTAESDPSPEVEEASAASASEDAEEASPGETEPEREPGEAS